MATKSHKFNPQSDEISLEEMTVIKERKRAKAQYVNGQISRAVGVKDSVVLGGIFSTFMTEITHKFLEEIGKYFLFPLSALAHAIQIVLAWRDVKLSKNEQRSGAITRAVVETVTGLSVVGIVVGALAFSAVFGALTPVLFAGTILAKTLFKAGSGIYYGVKGIREKDPTLKAAYYEAALGNAVATGAGILSTFAVTLVMKLGMTIFAPLGIAAGIVGGAYAIITGVQKWKAQSALEAAEQSKQKNEELDLEQDSENIMDRNLVVKAAPAPAPVPSEKKRDTNNNNNRDVIVSFKTRTKPQPIFIGKDTTTLFASDKHKDLSKSFESHLDKKFDVDTRTQLSQIRMGSRGVN